jgi:transcriptional regulator with XRE-family HTH domain
MPKVQTPVFSRYAWEALVLLGKSIRDGRISRRMTAADFARRAGISRGLLYRIERGDPACSIGSVFEAAALAGVTLFEPDRNAITRTAARVEEKLTLLPKAVRSPRALVKDAF